MASPEDTQEGDAKAKLLAEAFWKEGLDDGYWLPKMSQILGIKCREALQHLEYKDYLKLECEVRHPWEKKALQKLLKITDYKTDSKEVQKKHLEKTKQRQEVAKQALNDLTEMVNRRSHSQDALREQAETLWRAMEIPKEFWPSPKKPLAEILESIHKQLEQQQEFSAGRRENIPDTEVLRRASGGLALQGIYRTSRAGDVLATREQLLRIPEGFQLAGPEQGSVLESREFTSSAAESTFTKSMEQLGLSISVSAKFAFWRINLGVGVDHSSSLQSQDTHQSHSEQSYFCTTKFQYIPLASCYFQRHQLRLSDAALRELQDMEKILGFTDKGDNPMFVKMCESFFSRFGSHINLGPLHFGGIFWWKASTEGFRAEEREEVKRQTSEALNSFVRKSYGDFLGSAEEALDICTSSSQASILGRAAESSNTAIQLYVINTGGPADTTSLPQWKTGLVSDNTTWCVIDRGFELIPVWDVILCNHCGDFKSVGQMSGALRDAYKALTNESVGTIFGEDLGSAVQEARDFMETVKAWEDPVDERKLLMLMELKDDLSAKTRNHSVWINVCLSDKALQDFLVNTVWSCQESPPENAASIKAVLRSLLDPYIYSVKDFPEASFIMKWVFQTEHPLPRSPKTSGLEELIRTLWQMKEHIYAVTYAPGSSDSVVHEAKIEATLTSSLAIYSLLQSLQERAEKDMELLVLLIATSTGYQVESSTFQRLLGHPEIQYMAKEMQEAHEEYVNLKEQDAARAEASLLLMGLTVTPESQKLSLEQKRERLVFMEDHMKGLWSTRIKNLLQKHSAGEDWERLEQDLHSLISGCLDDKWDKQKMQNIVRDLEDTFATFEVPSESHSKSESSQSQVNEAIAKQEFLQLLKRLGLESHYPRKMGMADFCTICKISLQDRQPRKDKELPFYFLQKLLTVDYQVRYLTCWETNSQDLAPQPKNREQKGQHSDSFENFLDNLSGAVPEHASRDGHVHPMDLQMAIFHCADDFLRQTLATKLAFCQLALPLLLPNPGTSHIEFPLYAFSQIQRSWKETEKSGKQAQTKSYNNKHIFQAQTPIVSFIRIGSSASSSKSQLLNALLSKRKHDTFFHRHCRGSTRERLLMEGVVEIAWYCPRGSPDDTFESCVAFCNLHGDARDHGAQLQFLQDISAVNVVLVSDSEQMDNRGKKLLQGLWQSQRPLVCLLTEKENMAAGQSSKTVTIGIRNRNEAELMDQLTKIIRDLLEGCNPCFSLDDCAEKARQHGFVVDADQLACVRAEAKAKELVDLLKNEKLSQIKSQLLPLQGKLWYQWCKMDKELTRLQEKGNKSIEHHRSQIENEKKAIRRKQLEQAFPLNPLMKSFLGFLHAQPVDTRKYFLQWMKVFMDEVSYSCLEVLRRDYHELWTEILTEKKSQEKPMVNAVLLRRLDAISDEINDSSIGLEHLLREVGQIYEALEFMNCKKENLAKFLPEIAAELMVSGYPVELMDGDSSYLPLRWVGAIFDRLIERLGDKRVFVLSVLGIQSTGKSTLLNAMFGLQFKVSAGRCTRGAFMQLIPVGEELQPDLGFDFVLVVDTEGLRAIEMANKQSLNHDNELATFVIGVGNLTVINIFGENPSEMQDVLQIAVQAFLRMKQVNLSPSCFFVHQNVGEATAEEQNMEAQRRLQEKLDEMTVVAAQQEFCDISSFSDVIGFDVKTHIHYFAHLWEGNPPMAPPNPTYSQNVQQLKRKILQPAMQQPQGRILKLSSLKDRIGDLWNALVNENFVFSFKNSLEIAAYRKLESAFSEWTWGLRSHLLDVQMSLNHRIQNGDLQNVTREQLEGLVQEVSDAIEKEVEKYFREDKDREILVQWKSSTELKLKDLKESLLHETKKKCENLIELQKEQRKLDARKLDYEAELLRRSRELAVSLKGKSLSERELKDNFTRVWSSWIDEVSRAAPMPERVDVDAEIEDVLLEHFKEPGFYAQIRSFPKDRGFSFDMEKHISKKALLGIFSDPRSISNADVINFQHITDDIIARVEANLDKKEQEKRDYSRNFIHEILNEVQRGVDSVSSNAKCTFNKEYSMDLSLYLCRMAAERFKTMHKAFQEANDPVVYLSSKREDFFQCFQISCQGATSITTFAVFLCDKIEPALRKAVFEKSAKDIAEDMKSNFPDFKGNRANLEVCILRYLAEQENFEYFKQYLTSPKQFFQSYIERRVKSHCLDGSRRLRMFLYSCLESLYGNILSAFYLSIKIVKDRKDRQDKISLWLDEFCRELTEVINLPRSDLKGIEHQEVTDIEFLSSAMAEALYDMRDRLMKGLADADMSSFARKPHTILAEHFSGCWEQCPFCGAVCTNTMRNHDGDHQLVFHRPQALTGSTWYKRYLFFWRYDSHELVIDICSSSVASNCKFKFRNGPWIPYRKYREAGPPVSTWRILPDSSMQAYWKWFVSRFRTQLEAFCNGKFRGRGEIPLAWRRISKQEALSELDRL